MKRIAVITGGRDVHPSFDQIDRLLAAFRVAGIDVVRIGMARGVDMTIWKDLGRRSIGPAREAWPADWRRGDGSTDRGAGLRRNAAMLDGDVSGTTADACAKITTAGQRASLLGAFDGGEGTADCIVAAIERSIMTERIDRPSDEILVRITCDHPRRPFVAGAIIRGDAIVRAAPILIDRMRRAGAVDRATLRELVRRERWRAEIVGPARAP